MCFFVARRIWMPSLAAALVTCAILAASPSAGMETLGAESGAINAESPEAGELTSDELVTLKVEEKPLGDVLDYLAARGRVNLKVLPAAAREKRVSLSFTEKAHWRVILDFIAKQEGFVVDDSQVNQKLIVLQKPEEVTFECVNTPIHVVLQAIAEQANANIVVDPQVKGNVTVKLRGVPLRQALDMILKTLGYVSVEEKFNTIRITTPEKLTQQMETRVFKLYYLEPKGTSYMPIMDTPYAERKGSAATKAEGFAILDVLEKMKSAGGQVSYIQQTNSVIITDVPTRLDSMARVISELDREPKQVHITIHLVEMSTSNSSEMGIDWPNGLAASATGVSVSTVFPFELKYGNRAGYNQIAPLGKIAVAAGVNGPVPQKFGAISALPDWTTYTTLGSLSFTELEAALALIKTNERTRIIQTPQLVTLDNEPATLFVGQKRRYAEFYVETTSGGGTVSGYKEGSHSPVMDGIQMLIIPHVTGPENDVMLTIIPKQEIFVAWETFGQVFQGQGQELLLPKTREKIVVTKMLLRNNETGVIGGLVSSEKVEGEEKVPGLGDIPILGWLFKRASVTKDVSTNLLIFVTPRVIQLGKRDMLSREMTIEKKRLDEERTKILEELDKVSFGPTGEAQKTATSPAK